MSIQSEITRISGNISDALDVIVAKGVTVPSGSNSDDLADLIAQITGGGGAIYQDQDGYLVLDDQGGDGGGGVTAATGEITIASDVASPTSSQSFLFPGLDLDFQPDFLWIGKTRASWLEHYNDSVHWIVAIRKTMFPPWRVGNGTESDDSTSEYLFLYNNQATYNPTFDEGGNLIPGTGYGINLASTLNQIPFTNNMWSVNADGTLSYSRASNTAQITLKAGSIYRYFAIKV